MPVCSYLVFPRPGVTALGDRLASLEHCDVAPAENEDLLILVTDTPDQQAEESLQETLRAEREIGCMVLTFGDIASDAGPQAGRKRRRQPVEG